MSNITDLKSKKLPELQEIAKGLLKNFLKKMLLQQPKTLIHHLKKNERKK